MTSIKLGLAVLAVALFTPATHAQTVRNTQRLGDIKAFSLTVTDGTTNTVTITPGAITASGIIAGIFSGNTNLSGNATTSTNLAGTTNLIRGVPYVWPASNSAGVLTDNGSGALSWAASVTGLTTNFQVMITPSNTATMHSTNGLLMSISAP